ITTEEQIFYPAVKARRTEDILLESLEEHLSLKRLLADLITLDSSEQTFEPKFKVLKEQAEHHHEEEEEHLFPKVKRILDVAQLESLGTEIAASQSELKARDKPREMVITQTGAAAHLE
ncbi:MAG: hemerythrin domain-containing protein, partial [Pyrinomonadaceae bacterium]